MVKCLQIYLQTCRLVSAMLDLFKKHFGTMVGLTSHLGERQGGGQFLLHLLCVEFKNVHVSLIFQFSIRLILVQL